MQGQFATLDRADGDIDALSMRLARVRTLAYVANRADWLADPPAWQGRARDLEDRLSDTLHQSLMQRFVDRRTSTLLRSLEPARRSGPRRHRRRRRGDGRGPCRRQAFGRAFRARARRLGAGKPGAPRRGRAGGRPRDRPQAGRTRERRRRGLRSHVRRTCRMARPGGGRNRRRRAVQAARPAHRRLRRRRRSASAPRGGSRPMWRARPAGGSSFSSG